MKLRHLETFHAVMSAGSMTEAARRLNISQPAVSVMLKHTESQLGMKLFKRVGGRLRPTPEAEALFPDADSIFVQLENLKRVAQDLREGRTGQLSVAATPTLANALMPRTISLFQGKHPNVAVNLQIIATPQITDRVARREIDMGLVYAEGVYSGTDPQVVGRSGICCVMRQDHPLAERGMVEPADLQDVSLITYGRNTAFGRLIEESFEEVAVSPKIAVQANHALTCCLLASETGTVALVDRIAVLSNDLFTDMVVRGFEPRIESDLLLLFPRDRVRSRLTNEFAEILKKTIGDILGSDPPPSA